MDDPSINPERREHWKSNVEDAESLIRHSKQQKAAVEAELEEQLALLERAEQKKQGQKY